MSSDIRVEQLEPLRQRVAAVEAGFLAAACAFAMVMGTVFVDGLSSSRSAVIFVALLVIQVLAVPKLLFCRELAVYLAFTAYLFLTLLWAPDPILGMNTLSPAVNFVLIQLIVGSLVMFSDVRAVLVGTLIGVWSGAAILTYTIGFPLALPADMSYNAVAAVYLYGLFVALALACLTRSRVLLLGAALLAMVHIVATTSIKTNLGVLIGAVAAAVVYFRESLRLLRRHVLMLAVGIGVIAYGIASSNLAQEGLGRGVDRVTLGVNVLQTRTDEAGYTGFDERAYWAREGLKGWTSNPFFGHGVEAFRADYGITSHSTPVDLLYNTGLIGFLLFYGMYASLFWRMLKSRASHNVTALTLAVIVCNIFMSLSGTLFYQTFLAASIAITAGLLVRSREQGWAHRSKSSGAFA